MRFPDKKTRQPNIHLTALLDIVFLLLIFFLLSSSFVNQQGVQILVPEVGNESKDNLPDITVQVDRYGNYYFDGIQISDIALQRALKNRFTQSPVNKLAIHADRRVEYNSVVNVIDIAKLAGAKDFLLVNQQKLNP